MIGQDVLHLVAVLATATATALAVGLVTGSLPTARTRRRRPRQQDAQIWLQQAGSSLTPRQFRGVAGGIGALVLLVTTALTGAPAVAIVPALGAASLPRLLLARARSRRLRAVQEAWPDGIRDLVASISAGASLNRALLDLVQTGPPALREAFARYPTLAPVVGVAGALDTIKESLADPTSDRVIEVLVLAHEEGGHLLGTILSDLAAATTADLRVAEGLVTDAMEQRINARAVLVMPWLVLVALTVRDGPFRSFYQSAGGALTVLVGAGLSLVGAAIVARLAREPVEPRVLGAAATAGHRAGEAPR